MKFTHSLTHSFIAIVSSLICISFLSACSGGGGGGSGVANPPSENPPTTPPPSQGYTATYSQYLPTQADTTACSGVLPTTRTITQCLRDEDNQIVDNSFCSDSAPSSTVSSKAGTITVSSTNPSLTNGIEQMTCAVGATTGARQIVCNSGYHVEGSTLVDQNCLPDARSCPIANGSGGQSWNGTAWNPCQVLACHSGYVISGNACVSSSNSRTCSPLPANTTAGTQTTSDGGLTWGACVATACSAGYSVQGGVCVADGGGGSGSGALIYKDESVFHIRNDGSLYVWGSNEYGQLGVGDTVNKTSPIKVNLGVGRTAKKVVSNGYSTCSILDNNDLKCWGQGQYYQLGRGNTSPLTSPEATALLSNVKDVIPGINGYCAILNDNSLTCWGQNRNGSFGIGNNSAVQTPTTVPLGAGRTIKKLAMSDGSDHGTSCAILDDNSLKCWGYNGQGQSGVGSIIDTEKLFPQFVNLGAGRTAKEIYLFRNKDETQSSVCSILDDNSLKCWGYNTDAKLGIGNTNHAYSPTVVDVGAGVGVKSLYNNTSGAMCALLSTDRMACWGKNNIGQVGNGTTINALSPITYLPGLPGFIKEIVLGYGNSNYAIGLSGAVLSWGSNSRGQLGTGDTNQALTPASVTLGGNVRKIVATSPYTTCAILTNNSLECTGDNTLGTVGVGTSAGLYSSFVPVNLGGLSVVDLAMGDYWAGVLLSDNTATTWGASAKGKLGNGTANPNVNSPQTLIYP